MSARTGISRMTRPQAALITFSAVFAATSLPMLLLDRAGDAHSLQAEPLPPDQHRADGRPVHRTSSESLLRLFLQDQFGIAPQTIRSLSEFTSVADFLSRHIEEAGQAVNRVSLDDYAASSLDSSQPAVIFGDAGVSAVVAGALLDDRSRPCLQILESQAHCALETVDQLRSAGFQEAWVAPADNVDTVYRFENSIAAVDHLLVTTGLVTPVTDVTARFRISNNGNGPLVVGRIRPSCGCTSITPKEETELPAGTSQEFLVRVASGDKGSFVHQVNLSLFEKHTGHSQPVRILLCGSVLKSFSVTPESLDFGVMDVFDGQPVTKYIRISEADSDRFEITSLKSSGPKLDLSWQSRQRPGGHLREHMIKATIRPQRMATGLFTGEVVVQTTSARRESAVIPFRAQVRSSFEATPGVCSFGVVEARTTPRKQIVLTTRQGTFTDAAIISSPAWCACDVATAKHEITVSIAAQPDAEGCRFGDLRLRVNASVCSEDITIPCSMFVRKVKGSG